MLDLLTIERTLHPLFTTEADQLARQTGVVQRESKLTGPLLLLILVAGFIQHPTASYNILAQVAADHGVTVTRQAVQARLTSTAVTFFQTLLQRSVDLLQQQVRLPIPILTQFRAVYLLDSSPVALPDPLATTYPGTGGAGPQAGIKWLTPLGNPRRQFTSRARPARHAVGSARNGRSAAVGSGEFAAVRPGLCGLTPASDPDRATGLFYLSPQSALRSLHPRRPAAGSLRASRAQCKRVG